MCIWGLQISRTAISSAVVLVNFTDAVSFATITFLGTDFFHLIEFVSRTGLPQQRSKFTPI